jgi:hypothetical protein
MLRQSSRLLSLLMLISITSSLLGHDLYTARGRKVWHTHDVGACNGTECAKDWAAFEAYRGYRRADLMYTGTGKWNCHGRTFDNRQSWVPYADDFLATDAPYCPVTPQSGDTIIWLDGAGRTVHSVTLVSSWIGTSSSVVSKYGIYGQYKHTLASVVKNYGSRWTVTRFAAKTRIYSSAVPADGPQVEIASVGERLLRARENMPWYRSVLESEVIYSVEHERDLEQLGRLTDATVNDLKLASTDEERVRLLVADIQDASHYVLVGSFNVPQTDIIDVLQASADLLILAHSEPARSLINAELTKLATDDTTADGARASALRVLTETLPADEAAALLENMKTRPDTLSSAFVERMVRRPDMQ